MMVVVAWPPVGHQNRIVEEGAKSCRSEMFSEVKLVFNHSTLYSVLS